MLRGTTFARLRGVIPENGSCLGVTFCGVIEDHVSIQGCSGRVHSDLISVGGVRSHVLFDKWNCTMFISGTVS